MDKRKKEKGGIIFRSISILFAGILFTTLGLQISYAQKKKADKKEEAPAAAEQKKTMDLMDPDNPDNPIYLGGSGARRSTGDTRKSGYATESYKIGTSGWHPPAMDVAVFPKDKFGLIDWVAMYKKRVINPRGSLDPDTEEMPPMDLDVLFEMKGGNTDNVVFPHAPHTYWLDCTNCHDEIFIPSAGANIVTMPEIAKGQWCGRCHGKIAFPLGDCTRCHKYPKGDPIEQTASRRAVTPAK